MKNLPSSETRKEALNRHYGGKTVLVTGACGTVGSELMDQLLTLDGVQIRGIDNNESALMYACERLSDHGNLDLTLGDVRDPGLLRERFRGVDIVLHAAAMKHVDLCERSPRQAIACNVLGAQNVIEAANDCGVKQVNLTSSDKAVNPTNVMGISKLLGERLMTSADSFSPPDGPRFFSTRFGNVLGSRGSVIPLFRKQIAMGGPVTVTDKSMTRFIMTLAESVRLVLDAGCFSRGGEVFVTKMPVLNIMDLAQVVIEELVATAGGSPRDIEVRIIGPRPGEKMYEELLTDEEARRAVEWGDFLVIGPTAAEWRWEERYDGPPERPVPVSRAYNSSLETQMSREELRDYLCANGLLAGRAEEY